MWDTDDLSARRARLSPAKQALLEQRLRGRSTAAEAACIPPRDRNGPAYLSFAQQRLWFLSRLQFDSSFYNICDAVRLRGTLDVIALERSLSEIVRRHETLRTTFGWNGEQPIQIIVPAVTLRLEIEDLHGRTEAERATAARQRIHEEARRPFDLSSDRLLRAILLRSDEHEHFLVLRMHHIISDGWSAGVLVNELATLYTAFAAGKLAALPELTIQYADFAQWQRQQLSSEALQAQLAYWKHQLRDSPPVLELPTDRVRPKVQTFKGARQSLVLPKALAADLERLGRQESASLFMVLLAAFKALLFRYTGQHDLVVGSPIANRNHIELEPLIGFFVNMLVLRTTLESDLRFRELLQRVRQIALEAYANQDIPFDKVVEELQPARLLTHNPLFQVVFAFQNVHIPPLELPDLSLDLVDFHDGTAKFELLMSIAETAQGLAVSLEYNTGLFDDDRMTRMLGHYRTLLDNIVERPDERIARLPLLTQAEQVQIVVDWNDTAATFDPKCLHEMVEAQVERTPDWIAVAFDGEQLTYRVLDRLANQLANYLRVQGVDHGVFVGISMARSLDLLIAILAVLKAGGAYVPLDPTYPTERLQFMLADAEARVLLTQQRLAASFPAHETRIICLDRDWPEIERASMTPPIGGATPTDLAYIIYTSGSTGRPKGVACVHSGCINLLADFEGRQALVPGDRCSLWTSISFDVSVYEIFSALLAGAALHIVPETVRASGLKFVEWLRTEQITSAYVPPFALPFLAAAVERGAAPPLRRLLVGVEPIPEPLLARIAEGIPGVTIINGYGPTEASVCATLYTLPMGPAPNRRTPIGRPVRNSQIYLLDKSLQPVPIGVPGELYIAGAGLARGYVNRPELTAEKFALCPFSKDIGARMYRTGDLARYDSDGNIEFLGRTDFQVKIRGFRVELAEIEAVLSRHPAVRNSVVVAATDPSGGQGLIAYVVVDDNCSVTVKELRGFLVEQLPEYMVPSTFVLLDAFPLDPNGKVDRRSLPLPISQRPEIETVYREPQTETEREIAAIWKELLQLDRVGMADNFFELGGHSLLLLQVQERLKASTGRDISSVDLFTYPTVGALAAYLDRGQPASGSAAEQRTQQRRAAAGRQQRRRQAVRGRK